MADILTNSFDIGNWSTLDELTDGNTVQGVGDIEIAEVVGETEEGESVNRANAGGATTMLFAIMAEHAQNESTYQRICKTLMGGYWKGDKLTPFSCPYESAKYCTDVHRKLIGPHGGETIDGAGLLQTYQRCILELEFRGLPYNLSADINWITFDRSSSNARIAAPNNYYVFTAGSDNGNPVAASVWYSTGQVYVGLEVHQVSHDVLFGGNKILSSVDDYCGKINSTAVLDAPAGTLLLDTVDYSNCYRDYATEASVGNPKNNLMYTPVMKFLYNSKGWNKYRDSYGAWNTVGAKNATGTHPFEESELNQAIRHLEPSWPG